MKTQKIIGIFGDSFASLRPESLHNIEQGILPWPMHLSNLLNLNVITFAKSATGLWWSYEKFLQNYKKCSNVVFCYTDYNRWHTIQNPINSNEVLGLSHINTKQDLLHVSDDIYHIAELLLNVRPYLFNESFNIFVFQNIFNSVNKICRENDIKLVNLLSFDNFDNEPLIIDITNSYGSCLGNLAEVGRKELYYNDNEVTKQVQTWNESNPDLRFCHINPHNNNILAVLVKEALENHIPYKNIITDNRLSYDSKHLEYLIK